MTVVYLLKVILFLDVLVNVLLLQLMYVSFLELTPGGTCSGGSIVSLEFFYERISHERL